MSLTDEHRGVKSDGSSDAEALIREARRLRRRRWAVGAAVVAAALSGVFLADAFGGLGNDGPGSGAPGSDHPMSPASGRYSKVSIRTAPLSTSASYNALSEIGGRLLVFGQKTSSSCEAATVNPSNLRLSAGHAFDCTFWPPGHETYFVAQPLQHSSSNDVALRLERVDRATGRGTLGAIVMISGNSSTNRYESAYGDGSLWIYGSDTPNGGQLVRISDSTGIVLSRISMPSISKAIVAAGDSGFWIAPSPPTGWTGPGLYHVAPGAKSARLVERTDDATSWILLSGRDTWIDQFSPPLLKCDCQKGELLRFDGNTRVYGTPDRGLFSEAEADYPTAVGGEPSDIWTVVVVGISSQSATTGSEAVVRIDPDTGHWTVVARFAPKEALPAYLAGVNQSQATFFKGSFYYLEPVAGSEPDVLVRVRSDN